MADCHVDTFAVSFQQAPTGSEGGESRFMCSRPTTSTAEMTCVALCSVCGVEMNDYSCSYIKYSGVETIRSTKPFRNKQVTIGLLLVTMC